jgi:hypothetical protein
MMAASATVARSPAGHRLLTRPPQRSSPQRACTNAVASFPATARPHSHTSAFSFRLPSKQGKPISSPSSLSSCNSILQRSSRWRCTQSLVAGNHCFGTTHKEGSQICAALEFGVVGDGKSLQLQQGHTGSDSQNAEEEGKRERKKVVVVGAGWAGLGAAHHLCKQVRQGCKHEIWIPC